MWFPITEVFLSYFKLWLRVPNKQPLIFDWRHWWDLALCQSNVHDCSFQSQHIKVFSLKYITLREEHAIFTNLINLGTIIKFCLWDFFKGFSSVWEKMPRYSLVEYLNLSTISCRWIHWIWYCRQKDQICGHFTYIETLWRVLNEIPTTWRDFKIVCNI